MLRASASLVLFSRLFRRATLLAFACALATLAVTAQDVQEKALADMKSPNVEARRKAARTLGERRFREGAPALMEAAKNDSDEEVRVNALVALGRIKDFTALPVALDAMNDVKPDVRRAAIRAVVSYYIESDIGFLFAARRGLNALNPFLDTNEPTIVAPFTSVDARILTALADRMRDDGDVLLRRASVRALGVLRANSQAAALAAALNDPDLRIDVFRVFIKLGHRENGTYAIPYFNDESREVRAQAIATAGLLQSRAAAEPLAEVYRQGVEERGAGAAVSDFFKSVPERQKTALEALARIGDSSAREIFEENLFHPDDDRRRYANEGLARIGDDAFVMKISAARLQEKRQSVKLAQAFALYRLGRAEYLSEVVKKLESESFGDQAEEYLLDLTQTFDLHPYFRKTNVDGTARMMRAMGKIGTPADLPALTLLLESGEARIVNAANLAIQQIKNRDAFARGEYLTKPEDLSPSPKRPRRVARPSATETGGDAETPQD
jgi:HEAT repeat protein